MATKQLLLYLLCALAFTAVVQATEVRESRPIALVKPTSSIVYTDRANNTNDTCGTNTNCPIWAECNTGDCVCSENLPESLKCAEHTLQLSVRMCHCVTLDDVSGDIIEGKCFVNCFNDNYRDHYYLQLPQNTSRLNYFMCEKWWNRTGPLCGECLPGHRPLAYSYNMACVKCPEGNNNIWKYILAAYGPLTVFYFIVLFLKVNGTSSHLHGYLIFAQLFASPAFTRTLDLAIHERYDKGSSGIVFPILTTGYGIWNLDFFRWLYSDLCLDVSTLTVLALDYAVAIYPLLLTVVSYILIELHSKNVRIVVILWTPFRWLLTRFRRKWESRTTVIDAFATFFLLSFVKIAWTSFDIITPVQATSVGTNETEWVYYLNATVVFFGTDHLPYAIVAIVFCFVFIITSMLFLLFYQAKCTQRTLNCLRIHHQLIKAVMDSFQGYYKNGTERTKDYRWFAAVPLIGQFAILVFYSMALDTSMLLPETVVAVFIMLLTVIVQPYKNQFAHYTKIDVTFWAIIALCSTGARGIFYTSHLETEIMSGILIVVYFSPIIYISCVSSYWILSKLKLKQKIFRIRNWRRNQHIESELEAVFPDRVVNPENYQEVSLRDFNVSDDVQQTQDCDTYMY